MAENVRTLADLKERTLADVLHEVAHQGQTMMVVLEDGGIVFLQPAVPLKPLPALEGFVLEGWKDAIHSN